MGEIIVTAIRIIVPLYILKNPFWGMFASVLVDGADMELTKFLGASFEPGFVINFATYQSRDKILDLYMSSLALYTSFSWREILASNTSLVLYLWRFLGVLLFEITKIRIFLFFFPNLFEFFFLFAAFTNQFMPAFRIQNGKRLAIILLLLLVPKLAEEYLLHIKEAAPWAHFKHDILGWPKTPAD